MQSKNLGIVLIIIGLILMIYTGFNYVTTEKVVDIGPIQIDRKEDHPIKWSPIIGGILLLGGIVLIATNKNK